MMTNTVEKITSEEQYKEYNRKFFELCKKVPLTADVRKEALTISARMSEWDRLKEGSEGFHEMLSKHKTTDCKEIVGLTVAYLNPFDWLGM